MPHAMIGPKNRIVHALDVRRVWSLALQRANISALTVIRQRLDAGDRLVHVGRLADVG